jgi:hypothetical protein
MTRRPSAVGTENSSLFADFGDPFVYEADPCDLRLRLKRPTPHFLVESRSGAVAFRAPFPDPAHQTGRADLPHQMWSTTFDAGDLPVRFGGRGKADFVPTPILAQGGA